MSRWASPALRRVGYVALVAGALALLWIARESLLAIWRDHLGTFVVVGMLMAIGIVVQVLNFLQLLGWHQRLAVRPAIHAWALATVLNYLGPFQPGLALRFAYFKANGVPLSRSAETTLRQLHLSMWTALLAAAAAFALLGGQAGWVCAVGAVGAFIAWPRVLAIFRPWVLRRQRPAWLRRHLASLDIVLTPLPLRATRYFFLQHGLGALLILFAYRQFGAAISVGGAILVAVGVYVSSLVALLPNNLGILDGFYVATAKSGGLDASTALALALLLRGAHISTCLIVAMITWRPGGKSHGH